MKFPYVFEDVQMLTDVYVYAQTDLKNNLKNQGNFIKFPQFGLGAYDLQSKAFSQYILQNGQYCESSM